ncbi:hypothetical protein [Inhella gelatinilytica]|uniref:Uncharacterized protein n=1 Tax=Inhella gelatinilytica TaxID=2795030 RepID=A0A931NEM3_9BURK|nr:hypothetical protein [Inhella gelatinilytica]MBH9552666.1 hypothetical protein [Inhella gelatinilytica]
MSNPNTTISIVSVAVANAGTVNLTYSTGTNAPANNNGNVKEQDGQGAAQVTYTSAVAGWTVCGYTVSGAVPSDMTITTAGNSVLIVDRATATTQEQLNFCLQVKNAQGQVYTSTDPTVVNEPPK